MKLSHFAQTVSAAALIVGAAASTAHAQGSTATVAGRVFGAGATFPSLVYRDLFNCYANPFFGATTATTNYTTAVYSRCAPVGTTAATDARGNRVNTANTILFAPTGSGAGRTSFRTGVFAGSVGAANPVIFTDATNPAYPYTNGTAGVAVNFAASDATLSTTNDAINAPNQTTYTLASHGVAVPVPALLGGVGISYNLSFQPVSAFGSFTTGATVTISRLQLTRDQYCGIWSGAITNWNDSALTNPPAINGVTPTVFFTGTASQNASTNGGTTAVPGTAIPSIPITRFVRNDTSGTSFIFINHLRQTCGITGGALTDRAVNSGTATGYFNAAGIAVNNTFTVSGTALQTNGNEGVADAVSVTNGAVGYNSSDFVFPFSTRPNPNGGRAPRAALLGNQRIRNGAPYFAALNGSNVGKAISSSIPASTPLPATWTGSQSDIAAFNAYFAGTPVANPNSVLASTVTTFYPIVGFTYLVAYSCNSVDPAGQAVVDGYLDWLANSRAGAYVAGQIYKARGFAPNPSAVRSYVTRTLNPAVTSGACS